jgi:DNA helicase-2/ATP-dependent DNA helicase PcrA
MMNPARLETQLNPRQLQAVQAVEGPVQILAGAGSGKTRVITYRVGYMLGRGVAQSSILAVTFTNKAAREMLERVRGFGEGRSGQGRLRNLAVSTFHALGARILRENGEGVGLHGHFTIFDQTDRLSLLKEVARELGLDRGLDLQAVGALLSAVKEERRGWDEATRPYENLLREYDHRLRLMNAVDFDDLIGLPLRLFDSDPGVLAHYRGRFRYIMVDEFQDTSLQQYRMVRALAMESRNLCVVGDDDQSIYSWRGANYENLQQFERDFPERLEVKLEQNYRSTARILQAANGLITRNRNRKPKKLWTELGDGEPLSVYLAEDEGQEAGFIAEKIRTLSLKERVPLGQFGVLVRTNSLTRAIEEALLRERLPYKVSGGMSFFQRKEVKDLVSYLRVLANPDDSSSLLRILNTPRRGLGSKALELIKETAQRKPCSWYSALQVLQAAADSPLAGRAREAVEELIELLERFRSRILTGRKMAAALQALAEEIGYREHLAQEYQKPATAKVKWEYNVLGLVDSLAAYEENPDNPGPSLYEYLNRITLASQEEAGDPGGEEKVDLMTIHAAKGLEFQVVFIAGLEKDLIPHVRSLEEGETNLDEERRLFYVAITRARRRVFLTAAASRRRRGRPVPAEPSPFLEELPQEHLEYIHEEPEVSREEAARLLSDLRRRFT